MEINLKGKAPIAKTLFEANHLIKELWSIACDLNEKKNINSKNSSLPPSKDKSSKNKSNTKRNNQRKKNPKKPGGQPGHKKNERKLIPIDEVDHTINCIPTQNCKCGGCVIPEPAVHRRHQQYEFPVIKPIVTEYRIHSGSCDSCNKRYLGKLPEGVSWSMLGPRATAMTAHLSGSYRISKQNIVNVYQDLFDFEMSTGMVCKAEQTVSKALAQPVEEAKQFIQSAKNVSVHADETSFKEKGKKMWAWIGITCLVAVFIIRQSRGKKVAQELLGHKFLGILCSDRYSAYQWVSEEKRQICWAHLRRDFTKISERTGSSAIIGSELINQTDKLFHCWDQFKKSIIDRKTLIKKTRFIRSSVESLLRRGVRSKNKKTAGTCRNILFYPTAMWRFIEVEGIEPTNNLAEQMIRTLAIWRKTSFGTQSQAGTLYMERILTTVATCKLQKRNVLKYLTNVVDCYVRKIKPPPLVNYKISEDNKAEPMLDKAA